MHQHQFEEASFELKRTGFHYSTDKELASYSLHNGEEENMILALND